MKKLSRFFTVILCLTIILACVFILSACAPQEEVSQYEINTDLDTSQEITLRIASNRETWPEMDVVIAKFMQLYPNCAIISEYVENYYEVLPVRLAQYEDKVDIFCTNNIQEETAYKDLALNLITDEAKAILDLSGCNQGLVDNFRFVGRENTQYAVPFGGEMRGMYVNTTLLGQFGLEVPTNRAELLDCCQVLLDNGYIPLQSSPGTFAQQLLYPYICNSIVNGGNYEEEYAAIENIDDGISEYFRDAYTFLYDIVEKGYYDYKRVEEELGYTFDGANIKAKDFLNVMEVADDVFEKQDDVGKIAFIIDTQAFGLELAKVKSDYHSEIEYVFITSPVGEDGGYAYLSPAEGFAINKNSDNAEWALEFLNLLFTPENNAPFAEEAGKIPNTADALLRFDVPPDHQCDVGQMTFSYGFYRVVTTPMLNGYDDMIGISKMNAPKYMKDNGDGTYSLIFTVDDYLARLEAEFQKIKSERS